MKIKIPYPFNLEEPYRTRHLLAIFSTIIGYLVHKIYNLMYEVELLKRNKIVEYVKRQERRE